MNISAIIVAKNNPPHIFETIDSVKDFVSEIIIIDIGLDNQLKNKLKENSINQLIEFSGSIPYVELIREKTKQFAKSDWLIFLDPDEILTDKSKEIVKKETGNYDFFSLPRKNIIFNKWIQRSRWWPDYQVRIFRKNAVIWPTEIHQQPKASGKGLTIEAKEENAIIHHNYQSIDEYLSKAMRYAKAEAEIKIKQKKDFTFEKTIKLALSEFISRYFANDGYKDGMHGLALAFLQMIYYFLVYFYYWEQKKYFQKDEESLPKTIQLFFQKGFYEVNYWLNYKKIKNQFSGIRQKLINRLIK